MNKEVFRSINIGLSISAVFLVICISIGFFNTPFQKGDAVRLSGDLLKEREYVDTMTASIQKFTKTSLEIKDASDQANDGKIVPQTLAQIYARDFDAVQNEYNRIQTMKDVPQRFKTFHTTYLNAMEYQGMVMNETMEYIKDKEPTRMENVDKYNKGFVSEYNNAVSMFNRLLEEGKVR